ncbi:hypothetical protein QR685DRAFT_113560 [Neurospora intermedia]|uniref:BZIP domain-containing protein n=1 Tax=Neurospora intermedia TaxID=5142 RepID=A0ABR3CZW4_NEUIN
MTAVASAAHMAGQMTSMSMSIEQQQVQHRQRQNLQSDMDLSALQQASSSSSTTAATFAKRDSPSAVSTPASSAPSPTSSCGVSTPASLASITATTNLTGVPPIAPRPSVAPKPAPTRAASVSSQGAMSPVDCPTPGGGGPLSMTTKEWVIPPRPKPGRKPATDTPPTKRKAQNRAAQRAFRERRAARVGELEDQLEEQKEEHERVVSELQGRISHFEVQVQTLQSRCRWLEDMLEKEKQARNTLRNSWDNNMSPQSILPPQSNGYTLQQQQQQQQPTQQTQVAPKVDSVPIAEPRPTAQPFSISQIISPPEEAPQSPLDVTCGNCQSSGSCACAEELMQSSNVLMGCGGCTPEGRCACLEESIRVLAAADLKRPLPPSSPSLGRDDKRQRSDAGVEDMHLETDFTALFSSKKPEATMTPLPAPAQQQSQPITSVEMHESCGFCKDGTYCVCAESMALSAASMTVASVVQQVQMHTPPPSENDVVPMPMEVTATGAVKLPSFGSLNRTNNTNQDAQSKPPVKTGDCGPGGPGTCAQCLADPKSGLFCRSLAANFERNRQQTDNSSSAASPSGCCGGGGPGGGCCKTEKPDDDDDVVPINLNRYKTANQLPAPTPSNPFSSSSSSSNNVAASNFALSLSCAEAYKTIASHRHFEEAADDIGSWLPKLRAVPANPPPNRGSVSLQQSSTGKAWAPIEVEAASIMAVLKGFDVRFGRGE